MKRLGFAGAALLALIAALVVGVGPSSAAGPIGYTIIFNGDGTCDLATIDLTDGTLTDLPAASSAVACVSDLAADAEGAVWGIGGNIARPGSAPAADVETDIGIVAFSADGTPSISPVFMPDDIVNPVLAFGGIAFDPTLGAIIEVGNSGTNPTCGDVINNCLFTYDPETGVATPIGGSGQLSTAYVFLTSCTSALYSVYVPDGWALATVSRTTGEVTPGSSIPDVGPSGIDCAPGGNTLYAIASPPEGNGIGGPDSSVGTLDPATGEFTLVAPVSEPDAFIGTLAVPGTRVAPTTTTSQPAAVAAATVAPSFTG